MDRTRWCSVQFAATEVVTCPACTSLAQEDMAKKPNNTRLREPTGPTFSVSSYQLTTFRQTQAGTQGAWPKGDNSPTVRPPVRPAVRCACRARTARNSPFWRALRGLPRTEWHASPTLAVIVRGGTGHRGPCPCDMDRDLVRQSYHHGGIMVYAVELAMLFPGTSTIMPSRPKGVQIRNGTASASE